MAETAAAMAAAMVAVAAVLVAPMAAVVKLVDGVESDTATATNASASPAVVVASTAVRVAPMAAVAARWARLQQGGLRRVERRSRGTWNTIVARTTELERRVARSNSKDTVSKSTRASIFYYILSPYFL